MATDFSEKHGLVGSLFKNAVAEERLKLELTSGQLADFERDGFVAPVCLFNDAQIAVLRDELADLMQAGHEGHELCGTNTTAMSRPKQVPRSFMR